MKGKQKPKITTKPIQAKEITDCNDCDFTIDCGDDTICFFDNMIIPQKHVPFKIGATVLIHPEECFLRKYNVLFKLKK